ncbi:hypothetical protein ACO22_07837 [Paracoccidioides brasiliensis]|uniref:NAD-dependent epimerase/dehydratase domain-containing protein n=1 Tax=Paracoccidioides brasiliensis TaxID=121759 RepID=A0A1D2J3J4_PARBR|nr:hypothetical protein ACO22_07837 [Paracoccidioides brasiliensis]
MSGEASKPAILIVGGLGFLGRFLALFIHENNLASEVRIVDKLLPQLAWLTPEFNVACSQDKFVQADASREPFHLTYLRPALGAVESFPRIFDRANGAQFDYVINCGGESRMSQPEDVYRLRSHALSVALGKEAARRGVRAFIECSTATVYKSDREQCKEDAKIKPWFALSKWKYQAEEDLRKIPGLNLCILRFPHVYGEYDRGLLTTVICMGRAYMELNKPISFLKTGSQPMNTVYVKDAARALWRAAEWRANKGPSTSGDPVVFNIVDHNNTTKGDLAEGLKKAFGIEYSFVGTMMTQVVNLNLDEIIDEMNEECLQIWAELLNEKQIERPGPISPFLERDAIKDGDLLIDGSLFEQTTGFTYDRPTLAKDWIQPVVESFKRLGWWP